VSIPTRTVELSAARRQIGRPAADKLRGVAWAAAAAVLDPEVPVLTIEDLGVLRDVTLDERGEVVVTITPTYSGCPAMDAIRHDVEDAVRRAGFEHVEVRTVLSPAWSTDWMTESGREALAAFGIAPPPAAGPPGGPVLLQLSVRCPQCGSARTRETSRFGSTACKSMWVCEDCREPFDHFKAHR
jgi:ring-1,2-phenylacetyl-CoA epoxidase subunit PaaD